MFGKFPAITLDGFRGQSMFKGNPLELWVIEA
jgi:hypothetical protein